MRNCVLSAWLIFAFAAGWAHGQAPKHIGAVAKIAEEWQPGVQLYIKGDPGLSAGSARKLAEWLGRYPNWTVVLAESVDDESFSFLGTGYSHRAAAEHAVGNGLFNADKFADQIDRNSGLRNGAALLYTFDSPALGESRKRMAFCFTSPLHERYGLADETVWVSHYAALATARLKEGGKVDLAVMDPIEAIENDLKAKIAAEAQAREREIRQATALVENAAGSLQFAKGRLLTFQKEHPDLTGDLARPAVEPLEARLQSARAALTARDYSKASVEGGAVKQACADLLGAFDMYLPAGAAIRGLQDRLAAQKAHRLAGEVSAVIDQAGAALDRAEEQWKRGDSAYVDSFRSAQDHIAALDSKIHREEVLAATARAFRIGLVVCLALALAAAFVFAQVRRRPYALRSRLLVAQWEEALAQKMEALSKLVARRDEVLGDQASKVTFTGRTGELAKEVIRGSGDLIIMLSAAREAVRRANSAMHPRNPLDAALNLVSSLYLKRAVEILSTRPISFSPDLGLELVVGPANKKPEEVLWAKLEDFEPFQMSFGALMLRFAETAKLTTGSLASIEQAALNVGGQIKKMQGEVAAAHESAAEAAGILEQGYGVGAPALGGKTLSALEAALADAQKDVLLDPVSAAEAAKVLAPQIRAVWVGLQQLSAGVKQGLPHVKQGQQKLSAEDVRPAWIGRSVARLIAESEAYLDGVLKASADSLECAIEPAFRKLSEQVRTALVVNQRRREKGRPAIEEAAKAVETTRRVIADKLGVDAGKLFGEKGRIPAELLEESKRLCDASLSSLNDGALEQAETLLNQSEDRANGAVALANSALEIAGKFSIKKGEIAERGTQLASVKTQAAAMLEAIRAKYASAVMKLNADDPKHPRANDTIEDNLQEASAAGGHRDEYLSSAQQSVEEGRLFAAEALLVQAAGANDFIAERLAEISEKAGRLAETESRNAELLTQYVQTLEHLEGELADRAVRTETEQAFKRGVSFKGKAQKALAAERIDPFAIAQVLRALGEAVEAVQAGIRADRSLFEEAGRSVRAAAEQVDALERALTAARSDQFPDSRLIEEAPKQLSALRSAIGSLAELCASDARADWEDVDRQADDIFSQAGKLAARIKGDVQAAEEASRKLSSAGSKVRDARGWRGSYGVSIGSSYGSGALSQAKQSFSAGEYAAALELAARAIREAAHAVSLAEAEESRRRAEEERREREEEARRRRREAELYSYSSYSHRDSSGGSGSSFSFGGSGGSGISIGSISSGGSGASW